jgi:hypothetical protein
VRRSSCWCLEVTLPQDTLALPAMPEHRRGLFRNEHRRVIATDVAFTD